MAAAYAKENDESCVCYKASLADQMSQLTKERSACELKDTAVKKLQEEVIAQVNCFVIVYMFLLP